MRKDLVVFRCKSCIEDLKEYNPYVDKEGKKIPLDRIEVIEVEKDFCEYSEINLNSKPQLQAPIKLEGYPDRPWRVVVWSTIYDRGQGISEIFGWYESFADAKKAIEKDSLSKYWASYEIQLDDEEESIVVYHYANCRPLADEFIKVFAGQSRKTSALKPLKKYKVYVQFEGTIAYGVLAGDEEEAKEKALELYGDEEPEYLIDKLMYKVCDCESPGSGSDSPCIASNKTKFNRKLTGDEFNGLNFEDPEPFGHGEKSVFLISKFLRLTNEEAYAIRFHMGFSEEGSGKNAGRAFEKYPLALALNVADMEASYYVDDKVELELES